MIPFMMSLELHLGIESFPAIVYLTYMLLFLVFAMSCVNMVLKHPFSREALVALEAEPSSGVVNVLQMIVKKRCVFELGGAFAASVL